LEATVTSRSLALFGKATILFAVAVVSFSGVMFLGWAIQFFIRGDWLAWIFLGCGILAIATTFSIVRKVWRVVR
jgi:uncharacterized membrane protein YcjF (UPF0283 family)